MLGDVEINTHVVLYSGGPDSLITYHTLKERYRGNDEQKVIPVYFDLGHRYLFQEQLAVILTVPETRFHSELGFIGNWEEDDAHIYMRNIFLTMVATRHYPNSYIHLSVQKDELEVPDRRPQTFAAMNALFAAMDIPSAVTSLWTYKDKVDMVIQYCATGGSLKRLFNTWSCYNPTENGQLIHCGDCPACIRRHLAFVYAIGEDGTDYLVDPKSSETAKTYLARAKAGYYSEDRNRRILSVLA